MLTRAATLALSLVWGALAIGPLGLSLLLLWVAETGQARLYAVTAVVLLALPIAWLRAIALRTRRRLGAAAVLTAAFAIGYGLLYQGAPSGAPLSGSRLRSEFLGEPRYGRGSIATLLPEIDQIKLGSYVMPLADRWLDRAQATHLRASAMRHYRAMEADPEFRALGTVMNFAYRDQDAGHLYAYAPLHAPGERLAALVFLHGSGGNFKAYFWLWKRFADQAHVALVCPSFGFGNWFEPGGTAAIERARRFAIDSLDADESKIVLVGLSNGGTGVTRAAAEHPDHWAGLVLYSAVIEAEVVARASFVHGWSGRPILVIHGREDERIPIAAVDAAVTLMRSEGANVQLWTVDGEDHFLLFDQPDATLARVSAWLDALR